MFNTLTPQALLFFAFTGGVIYLLTRYLGDISAFYYNRVKWETEISRETYLRYDKILTARLPYYRKLDIDGKAKFIHRLTLTMHEKEFTGRNKLVVTEEMRVVVCGAMVQITFGLKKFKLAHFERVLLYPEKFYHSLIRAHLKGGTSPSGVLMLSWKDVVKGFSDENDNYNLALHEMAHALKLDVTEGDDFDVLFSSYLDEWLEIGENVRNRMLERNDVKLRDYAKTNLHEFFAVCVENFFETPHLMKQHVPNVYNHLCVLLNQDPCNPADGYELPENFAETTHNKPGIIPVPSRVSVSLDYTMWHWTYSTAVFGLILIVGVQALQAETVIGGLGWKGIYGITLLTVVAAQLKLLYKRDHISIIQLLSYFLLGATPIIMLCFYLLNIAITTHHHTEHYRIVGYHSSANDQCLLELENHALENNPSIREISMGYANIAKLMPYYYVEYNYGILGYRVATAKRLSFE